jgi:succinate dehydrogenase / fumarate reductase flavoprotein subunit
MDNQFRESLIVSDGKRGIAIRRRPVAEPSKPVQAALDEHHELDYHHLE